MSDRDDFVEAMEALLPPFVYRETHDAKVVYQHGDDGSIDVTCDDPRIGDLTRVEFRSGIPGTKIELRPEDRVKVAFDDGRPDGFFAFAPNQDPNASKPVARVGDIVDLGKLAYVGTGTLQWFDPTLPPNLNPITISAVPVPIHGLVASGSSRMKLGD
jgi:hypothetical protein